MADSDDREEYAENLPDLDALPPEVREYLAQSRQVHRQWRGDEGPRDQGDVTEPAKISGVDWAQLASTKLTPRGLLSGYPHLRVKPVEGDMPLLPTLWRGVWCEWTAGKIPTPAAGRD